VNQVLQNAVNQAVDGLVRYLGASHVYLFGSCAKENTSSPNDIDLLVVVPDGIGSRLENARKAYRATRSLPFSRDIIVEHESVFRKRARWTSSIEREVLETGKLIYGRT
jgi:predicted nucleotidyltransferase